MYTNKLCTFNVMCILVNMENIKQIHGKFYLSGRHIKHMSQICDSSTVGFNKFKTRTDRTSVKL